MSNLETLFETVEQPVEPPAPEPLTSAPETPAWVTHPAQVKVWEKRCAIEKQLRENNPGLAGFFTVAEHWGLDAEAVYVGDDSEWGEVKMVHQHGNNIQYVIGAEGAGYVIPRNLNDLIPESLRNSDGRYSTGIRAMPAKMFLANEFSKHEPAMRENPAEAVRISAEAVQIVGRSHPDKLAEFLKSEE